MRMPKPARGFTLLELMISITIGLFLVGGMLTVIQTMKRTQGMQNNSGNLQDNMRLALGLMTDVIQATGDYPNPMANTTAGSFPAVIAGTVNFTQSEVIIGTGAGNAAAPGDTVAVRYMTSGTDKLANCMGNTSAVQVTWINQFSIDANGNLQCTLTTINSGGAIIAGPTTATLVSGVTNLQIVYGLKTNTTSTLNSVDTYLDANAISAMPQSASSGWTQVRTVQLTMTFTLPNLPTQTGAPTQVPVMRVVDVMNQVGLST